MNLNLTLRRIAVLGIGAASLTAFAADAQTFMNGRSIYGQSASAVQTTRVINLSTAKRPNIDYGETVKFVNDLNQDFTWTFNGLDQRAVGLTAIAPAGFSTRQQSVAVGRSPANRH
jgi:hypothetical protein